MDYMTADILGIFEIIEDALAYAGYKILDGDKESVVIRHAVSDTDYEIKVLEIAC